MDIDEVKNVLISSLMLEKVYVNKDNGDHYRIIVVDNRFLDMGVVQRQKIIYMPLADYIMNGLIHSVSIRAFTIMEWEQECISIV